MYYEIEELRERIKSLDINEQDRDELLELVDKVEDEVIYNKVYEDEDFCDQHSDEY